jgi:moderate conductance mechanosensitive channel
MVKALIALVAILMVFCAPAGAQTSSPPPAASTSAAEVTPEQAARALTVLQDPAKRGELIETLQTIAHASPGPAPTSAASAVLALQPDSLGAELVVQASGWAKGASQYALAASRMLTSAPALWRGLKELAASADARAELLDVSWRLAITSILAFMAEQLLALALRRPLAALGQAPVRAPSEGVDADDARLLHRLPPALLRLTLMLLPIGAFAVAGMLLTSAEVDASEETRLVILEALKGYILCRAIIALARALASSQRPRLRLLRVDDATAAYIEVWARRLVVVIVGGATIAETADLLGADPHLRRGLVKLVAFVLSVSLLTIVLQCRALVAGRLRAPDGAVGSFVGLRNRTAETWHFGAIAAIITLWFLLTARTHDGSSRVLQLIVISVAALAFARVVSIVALGALDRLFRGKQDARGAGAISYYLVLRGVVSIGLVCTAGVALLEIWGVEAFDWFEPGAFGGRLVSAAATIAVSAVAALAIWQTVNGAMDRHLDRLTHGVSVQRAMRLRTMLPILRTTLLVVILTTLTLTALSEVGVNIAPLLAGAGIVGIAIGFGSQKLVQDLITGLFLLLENAIQVGDQVTAAGLSGSVETLSIRTMRLRAGDGSVHIVPFSSVTSVTNANRGLGNAAISVCVDFGEDTDRVEDALREIAQEMRKEARFKAAILSEIQLWGVDKVDGAGATIVGQIVCTDGGRWGVQREFNRRMKQRFQELGIRIAPPTPTVVFAQQVVRAEEGTAETEVRRRPRSRGA